MKNESETKDSVNENDSSNSKYHVVSQLYYSFDTFISLCRPF